MEHVPLLLLLISNSCTKFPQENDFIVHNLARNGIGWIGYIKDPSTDNFEWTDGSDPDFYRWGPNRNYISNF